MLWTFIGAVIVLLTGVAIIARVALAEVRLKRWYEELAAAVGQPGASMLMLDWFGRPVEVTLRYRFSTPTLRVAVTSRAPGPAPPPQTVHARGATGPHLPRYSILLRPETWLDRVGKALRLNREVSTGDPVFDARVYIESYAPDDVVRWMLARPELRRSVVELIDHGVAELILNSTSSGSVEAMQRNPTAEQLAIAHVQGVAWRLVAVAAAIPPNDGEQAVVPFFTRGTALVLVSMVGSVAGCVWMYVAERAWPTLDPVPIAAGFGVGALAWFLSLPLVALTLAGKFGSLRSFVAVGVLAALALLTSSKGLVVTANGVLDTSPPRSHRVRVVDRAVRGAKRAVYFARLSSFRPGEATLEVEIDSALHTQLGLGRFAVITTRSGAFGWEWMTDIRSE